MEISINPLLYHSLLWHYWRDDLEKSGSRRHGGATVGSGVGHFKENGMGDKGLWGLAIFLHERDHTLKDEISSMVCPQPIVSLSAYLDPLLFFLLCIL